VREVRENRQDMTQERKLKRERVRNTEYEVTNGVVIGRDRRIGGERVLGKVRPSSPSPTSPLYFLYVFPTLFYLNPKCRFAFHPVEKSGGRTRGRHC